MKRAAGDSALPILEHHHRRAFAQHQPAAVLAKGLHEAAGSSGSSVASVFNASHALSVPKLSGASLPPAIITSVSPQAMRRAASPIATADDEHAVE